jgi:hypothetical protein
MLTPDSKIVSNFAGKLLGTRWNNKNIFVGDLDTREKVIHELYQFLSRESDLNQEAVKFLDAWLGIDEVAKILFEHEDMSGDFHRIHKTEENLSKWLRSI